MATARKYKSVPRISTSSDGTKIYYEITRQETTSPFLIFLHGLGGDLAAWDEERNGFHDLGYSHVAIDLRGHGLSGHPHSIADYSLQHFATDVIKIINDEDIDQAVIIGHCFGGMVSMVIAGLYHPIAEKFLILIDTGFKPPFFGQMIASHMFLHKIVDILAADAPNFGHAGHGDYEHFIGTGDYNFPRLMNDLMHTSFHSYLACAEQLLAFDGTELLNRISTPTLVIGGGRDRIFPPKIANDLSHRIKNSELEIIDGANHILVINNPDDIVQLVHHHINRQVKV